MTSIARTNARRSGAPTVGALQLRPPPRGSVTARLIWPPAAHRHPTDGPAQQVALPPLLLLRSGRTDAFGGANFATRLSTHVGALVLDLCGEGPAGLAVAEFALGWLADHAAEIGADPHWLAVVGVGSAAQNAAAVACQAGVDGWPALTQQVIVFPDAPSLAVPAGFDVLTGVCGCSLIIDRSAPDGHYCETLRAAGVPVRRRAVAGLADASKHRVDTVLDAVAAALQVAWCAPAPVDPPADTASSAPGSHLAEDSAVGRGLAGRMEAPGRFLPHSTPPHQGPNERKNRHDHRDVC